MSFSSVNATNTPPLNSPGRVFKKKSLICLTPPPLRLYPKYRLIYIFWAILLWLNQIEANWIISEIRRSYRFKKKSQNLNEYSEYNALWFNITVSALCLAQTARSGSGCPVVHSWSWPTSGLKHQRGRTEWHSFEAGRHVRVSATESSPAFQLLAVGQSASGVGANGFKSLTSSFTIPFTHTLSLVFQCLVPPDPPMYFQWATATLPPSSKLQTLHSLARSLPPLKAA